MPLSILALEVYEEMKESRVKPNLMLYWALFEGLVKAGKENLMMGYFKEMQEQDITPTPEFASSFPQLHFSPTTTKERKSK